MKKILFGLLMVAIVLMMSSIPVLGTAEISSEVMFLPAPVVASAEEVEIEVTIDPTNCCDYIDNDGEPMGCCWLICCEQMTNWYRVSFFDENHDWVTMYVEMPVIDGRENAAEYFGRRAGYDCFVGCAVGYTPDTS